MQELSNGFVCAMGVGIVFLGLVCLVLISLAMSGICKLIEPKKALTKTATPVADIEEIPNKQELIAAVSAVLAEELGKDISAIRILSFKKM